MKQKVSISIDGKTIKDIEAKVAEGLFRNKSHLIEYAVKSYLKGGNDE